MALRGCAPAFLSTALAGFGTLLAMIELVLRTLVAAFLADACTQGTNGLGKLAPTRNNGGGETANPRTIHAEGNTRSHGLGIGFLKAGDCAVFAGGSTVIAGFETSAVLSVHGALLESEYRPHR